jgi:ubiquinone/menaquinone biosynthesis C-methylase UbiE
MLIDTSPRLDFMLTLSRSLVGMSTQTNTDQRASNADSLIRLLDASDALPEAATLRARTYDLLALPPDVAVVDVGCGTGRAVAELAGRGVRPVGVDASAEMVSVARRRWPAGDFRIGDAHRLPLPDGAVSGYRADKVYHELDDPAGALAEASRVLAPGGRIVLLGQDWDTFIIDSDDQALTRTIVHARADTVASPWAARRYRNLLLAAGFRDVTLKVHTGVFTDPLMLAIPMGFASAALAAGAISREQTDMWTAEQARRAQDGTFFLAIPLFIAAARRP